MIRKELYRSNSMMLILQNHKRSACQYGSNRPHTVNTGPDYVAPAKILLARVEH